jgi:hypothetical protein
MPNSCAWLILIDVPLFSTFQMIVRSSHLSSASVGTNGSSQETLVPSTNRFSQFRWIEKDGRQTMIDKDGRRTMKRSGPPPRVLKWHHQADFIILLAGTCAITIGGLGFADAAQTRLNNKAAADLKTTEHTYNLPVLHAPSSDFPLLAFGFVTAIAWLAARRACFRVLSLDANYYLQRGVKQNDLAEIFELQLPTKSWMKWRARLWRSSLLFLLQFALYVGVGVCYRRAFQHGDEIATISVGDTASQFLMGCPGRAEAGLSSFDDTYGDSLAWLLGVSVNEESGNDLHMLQGAWDRSAIWNNDCKSKYNNDSGIPVLEETFFGVQGWHGSLFANNLDRWDINAAEEPNQGLYSNDFHGPFILGVMALSATGPQVDFEAVTQMTGNNYILDVADHPVCGPLPQLCYPSNTRSGGYMCTWLGLVAENRTASISWSTAGFMNCLVDRDPSTAANCPLRLEPDIYNQWLNSTIMSDAIVNLGANNLDEFWTSNIVRFPTYFAALVAELMATKNDTLITDRPVLEHYGLYMPLSFTLYQGAISYDDPNFFPITEMCMGRTDDSPINLIQSKIQYGLPIYTGTVSFTATKNDFVEYQIAAAILIMVWGAILLMIAYPFKSLLVKGSLNQYMSFGADIGLEYMNGASLGHEGSRADTLWRLTHRRDDYDQLDELISLEKMDFDMLMEAVKEERDALYPV